MKYKVGLFIQKKPLLLLFATWLLIQTLLLYKYGIITNNEATKYIREANNLLHHKNLSEQKYIFYSSYVFLHVIFIKLGFEIVGVYIFQLLVNLIATFLFYKTALNIYKNKSIAFIATFLLIMCFPWQYWTVCLYTESFFCSLIIIFTYCLFGINKNHRLKYVYTAVVFAILLFARPSGIFLIPVIICLLVFRLIKLKKIKFAVLCIAVLFTGFIYLLLYEMKSASSFNFIKPFIEQNIICDVPDRPVSHTNSYNNSISGVLLYIIQNPLEFLRLCSLRFVAFWGLTRPYYSEAHNWILRLLFYPLYFFVLIKLKQQLKLNRYFILYCLGVITVFTLSVMLTCDEWSNRFIMPVIPIIIWLASYGIFSVFKRKINV